MPVDRLRLGDLRGVCVTPPGHHRLMSQWNARWDDWTSILAREVAALPWGWFLIIEYAAIRPCPIGPYAQVSRYPQGFYCEAVGEAYLPA